MSRSDFPRSQSSSGKATLARRAGAKFGSSAHSRAGPEGKVKPKRLLAKGFRGTSQTNEATSCDRHESKARTDLPTRKQESDDGVLGQV